MRRIKWNLDEKKITWISLCPTSGSGVWPLWQFLSFLLRANGLYMSTSTFSETHGYFGGANDVASVAVLGTASFLLPLKHLNLQGSGIKTLHHLKWGSSGSIRHPSSLTYSFSDLHSITVYKEFFTCFGLRSWVYGASGERMSMSLKSQCHKGKTVSVRKASTSIWATRLYLHLVIITSTST